MNWKVFLAGALCVLCAGCGKTEEQPVLVESSVNPYYTLKDVAKLLATVPLGTEQMTEVHDAAAASVANGYDEEYLMRDIFACPGAGVGDGPGTRASKVYTTPLRDLLRQAALATKAGDDAEALLDSLAVSDIQIYWPYSENWDGKTLPIVTYDPGNADDTFNVGWLSSGEQVLVDEELATERPVWVVSNNSDAGYTSLEMLRRQDPTWGEGGGNIVIKPRAAEMKTLVLRSFTSHRQFDNWFAGASEFFVKAGSVKSMVFASDDSLLEYRPEVTDFMIVVRRKQVDKELPFNAVIASEWVKSLTGIGFMIIEDDGGTITNWKCEAVGKYNSKSYGVEISIPVNSRDDIVWRGSLTRSYIEKFSGKPAGFGEVELVLELI